MEKILYRFLFFICIATIVAGCAGSSPVTISSLKVSTIEGDRKSFDTLIAWLEDSQPTTRASVARALSETGNKEAIEPIFRAISIEGDRCCRVVMAKAINKLNPLYPWDKHKDFLRYVREDLLQYAKTDDLKEDVEMERIRCNIELLGEIGTNDEIPLIESCQKIYLYVKKEFFETTNYSAIGETHTLWKKRTPQIFDMTEEGGKAIARIKERERLKN